MNKEFQIYDLQDLCIDIIDCPHTTPKWKDYGITVIRNYNIKDGKLDFSKPSYVDESTYTARTKRGVPEYNDLIISREAPMGAVALIPKNLVCCLGQRLVLLKINKEVCNPKYLLYVMQSKYVKDQIKQIDKTGSIVSNLNIGDLKKLKIPIIKEQEKVSLLLSKLDKKIETNNKINKNLFDMAYCIYMHSFFAKQTNAKLADILVEHSKSKVQVGYAKGLVAEYPFFTSGAAILEWDDAMVTGRNCFLNTGGNADVKFYVGDAAYSTDTWCISAKDNLEDYLYLFLYSIKNELNLKFFQGTGLKHLQKPLLKLKEIYKPTKEEIMSFNEQVKPLFSMISANTRENQRLNDTRDFLLPLLMNGQAKIVD